VIAILLGLTACVFGGNSVNEHKANLANQRKAAISFIEDKRGVEAIRFTREGGPSGFGAPWKVNAVVTIAGEDFQAILGTQSGSGASEPLPTVAPGDEPATVIVTFSDGTSEVIE